MSGSISGPTFFVGGVPESQSTIENAQATVLNSPPPTMQFMAPPSPAPQPAAVPAPSAPDLGVQASSSGTQFAGITNNQSLQTVSAGIGDFASGSDYAVTGMVAANAARTAMSAARGDIPGALTGAATTAGSAYLGSGSLGRVGMDLFGNPNTTTFVDETGGSVFTGSQ